MSMLRALHRWTGAVTAFFMIIIALTGLGLQLDLLLTGTVPPGNEERSNLPIMPLPNDKELGEAVRKAMEIARAKGKSLNVTQLTIDLKGGETNVTFGDPRNREPVFVVNLESGQTLPNPFEKFIVHAVLQNIHAGYFLGYFGQFLSIILSVGLLILSVTGFQVYWKLLRARRKIGRSNIFWK